MQIDTHTHAHLANGPLWLLTHADIVGKEYVCCDSKLNKISIAMRAYMCLFLIVNNQKIKAYEPNIRKTQRTNQKTDINTLLSR